MSLSRKSLAPHRNYSKIFPNVVLAEIPLHLIEDILRHHFEIVS